MWNLRRSTTVAVIASAALLCACSGDNNDGPAGGGDAGDAGIQENDAGDSADISELDDDTGNIGNGDAGNGDAGGGNNSSVIQSVAMECDEGDSNITVTVETSQALQDVSAYVVDSSHPDCMQGDGNLWEAGYAGPPDCWEEVHPLEEVNSTEDGATYEAVLAVASTTSDAAEGMPIFHCDENAGAYFADATWVFHATYAETGDELCWVEMSQTAGVESHVADEYACN